MKAFAHPTTGLIRFGDRRAAGAVELAQTVGESKGARAQLRSVVDACARRGYKAGVFIVAGVPEAATPDDAAEAIAFFKSQLRSHLTLKPNPLAVVLP